MIILTSFFVDYTIHVILLVMLLSIPTVIDGLTQLKGLRECNNNLRFITDLMVGYIWVLLLLNL